MSPLACFRRVIACSALVLVSGAAGADSSKPTEPAVKPVELTANVPAQIARSALLSVEATAKPDVLQIAIRRVTDNSPVVTDDITVAIDGHNEAVTRDKGIVYELAINDLRGEGVKDVDVTVAHDGIREIVSGKVSVAEPPATSLLRDHKQVAWWALNIVIILIAAMAFSRKKPAVEEEKDDTDG
ncbi:MAG: hypothetical protein JSR66_15205 [Proteobacteria bacterium]|nr:hypothetical protein [Pseudomonadota bacterium]